MDHFPTMWTTPHGCFNIYGSKCWTVKLNAYVTWQNHSPVCTCSSINPSALRILCMCIVIRHLQHSACILKHVLLATLNFLTAGIFHYLHQSETNSKPKMHLLFLLNYSRISPRGYSRKKFSSMIQMRNILCLI